jgi:DNA-binding Xre family transcriptional regulator
MLRLRLPELLERRGMTPYALAKASGGRISMSTAYRLARLRGRLETFDRDVLDALCDVLQVEPGELLERGGRRTGR